MISKFWNDVRHNDNLKIEVLSRIVVKVSFFSSLLISFG